MPVAFGLAEILQRTRAEEIRPSMGFDTAQWAQARRAGNLNETIVDIQAANTLFCRFGIPREGLYRVLPTVSAGVLATVRLVDFQCVDVNGAGLFAHRWAMGPGNDRFSLPPFTIYLFADDELRFQLVTAMVLGDDMTGSITNWELVV